MTTTSLTGSKKRKRSNEIQATKFYAVRAGVNPGVYGTWKECFEQVNRFKCAQYKAFLTYAEAEDFVAGKSTQSSTDSAQSGMLYGVAVGRCPGVYTSWTEASLQIEDMTRPKYKKFSTRAEAEAYVLRNGEDREEVERKSDLLEDEAIRHSDALEGEPRDKRLKIKILEPVSDKVAEKKLIKVYTDGSSRRNGQVGARAGVGVFFGTDDPRNVSERLQGQPQTNQRAELTAILRALQICPAEIDIQILTDSMYSINCLTKWYTNWLKNRWRTSAGSPVINKDLVQAIRLLMDRRKSSGSKTDLIWIRGHNHDVGNEAADRLAVAGCSAVIPSAAHLDSK